MQGWRALGEDSTEGGWRTLRDQAAGFGGFSTVIPAVWDLKQE